MTVTANDTFSVHDTATNTNTMENPSAASTTLYLTVASVNISPGSTTYSVGQGVNISASVAPSDLIGSPPPSGTFQWNLSGTTVAGFTVINNGQTGTMIPLSNLNGLASPSVHAYWVDGGSQSAKCTIAGLSAIPQQSYTLYAPAFTASPQFGTTTYGAYMSGSSTVFLHDGVPATLTNYTSEGIHWTLGGLTATSYHFAVQWLQEVTNQTFTFENIFEQTWTLSQPLSYPALDSFYPYPIEVFPDGSDGTEDSPGFSLSPSGTGEAGDYVVSSTVASDSFKDWLMYEPTSQIGAGGSTTPITDAIYVPILKGGWSWSASVANGLLGSLGYTCTASGSDTDGTMSPSSTFPEWNHLDTGNSATYTGPQ